MATEINQKLLKQSLKNWLLKLNETEKVPKKIAALCFNLYEEPYAVEIVGSKWFDEEDTDWVCEEDYTLSNREELFKLKIPQNVKWEKALKITVKLLKELSSELAELQFFKVPHVAAGFVDGDLEIIK